MTTQPSVTPRRPDEPEVDHTVLLLVHRAMLTDAARFAELLTDLAREGLPIPARRAVAIRDYLLAFGTELHEHHSREDGVAWPVIAASAGAAVDLAPLTEDHTIPQGADQFMNAEICVGTGAALAPAPDAYSADAVTSAAGRLLAEPGFERAAGGIRAEIDAMPGAADVLDVLTAQEAAATH